MTKLTVPVPGVDRYRTGKPQKPNQAAAAQRQTILPQPPGISPMPRAPLRPQRDGETPVPARVPDPTPHPAPAAPRATTSNAVPRINPAAPASPAPLPPPNTSTPRPATSNAVPRTIPAAPNPASPAPVPAKANPATAGASVLTLEQFLQRYRDLPEKTAALGYCDDQLPVLFDFTQATAGPLLILGDHGCGKTNLLRVLLASAARANPPHQFKYLILGARPDEYGDLAEEGQKAKHCIELLGTYDRQAQRAIVRMAALAEERYNQYRADPPALLVIDDMKFLTTADTDVRLNFEWLVKHGPGVRVWPVVALQTEDALDMGRWTAHFRTRILGTMPEKAANRLGMYPGLAAARLERGKQFGVHVNDSWMRFWAPLANKI